MLHAEKERTAHEMLARLKAAPALLDVAECETLEEAIKQHGYTRRLALAVLSRSGTDLLDEICRNRELAVAMADCLLRLRSHSAMLRELRRLARAAEARLAVALAAREDMREVFACARRGGNAGAQGLPARRRTGHQRARARDGLESGAERGG